MYELVPDEKILGIRIMKYNLDAKEPAEVKNKYHAYVLLQTRRFFYFLEKFTDDCSIQQSQQLRSVSDMYENGPQIPSKIKWDVPAREDVTMIQLFDYLYDKDLVNKSYNLVIRSCKHFAKEVYNLVKHENAPEWVHIFL